MELEEHTHPFGVTFGKVVVHGNHMHAFAGQCVEVNGQRSHEGLTFTGGHLGDLTVVQDDTAYQLHVVVHHVPSNHIATCGPSVFVVSPVVADVHAVAVGRDVAVAVGGGDLHLLVFGETAGGVLHHCKSFGEYFKENVLRLVVRLFLQLFNTFVEFLFLIHRHVVFLVDTGAELCQFCLFSLYSLLYFGAEFDGLCAQFVVAKEFYFFVCLFCFVYQRHHLFKVALRLISKKFL